jgi:hypothetical protein
VPRRPSPEEFDRPLTPQELAERKRRLSMLSVQHVADAYRQAHEACRDGWGPDSQGERGPGACGGVAGNVEVETEGAGREGMRRCPRSQ